jgi:signal transduction histidine kinase
MLLDGRDKITLLSPEAGKMLELNPAKALGAGLEILPAALQTIISQARMAGQPPPPHDVELPRSGGPLSVRVSAAAQTFGQAPPGVALVLQDLTCAGEVEQQIRQLDRLADVGTLAAGMAHEIKNALVAGKTFIDLLLEKNQDAELVEVVRRELGRIDAIVTRMLRFAAPARGEWKPVSLHELLEHALRLLQPQINEKAIALARSFHNGPARVKGDDYELEQAMVNLLLNALEAMAPNGTLTVATAREFEPSKNEASEGNSLPASAGKGAPRADFEPAAFQETAQVPRLRVTIQDTGPGIAPEHMAHLFEPFFTTKTSGTGLGLAITRRIIHEHGGVITVDSRPGEGTTFQILLPALEG